MKKYIIGFVLGSVLFSSGVVLAKTVVVNSWYQTDRIEVGTLGVMYKTYDENTNVVCYTFQSGYAGGVSCLKNNQINI